MKKAITILCIACLLLSTAPPAEAIVILPAIILIPIAKLVASLIGALSLPTLTAGVLGQKLFGIPVKKVIFISVSILLIIGCVAAVLLKMENANRPWY
jgi:hypothetical protein